MNPFGGFEWQRRSIIVQTSGRRHGTIAHKVEKIKHAIIVENGVENVDGYRAETKGFLSDQGSNLRTACRASFGDKAEVMRVLRGLKDGSIGFNSSEAKGITFLWNAIDQPGIFHILCNALDKSLSDLPEFKDWDEKLKACVKLLGELSYKQLCLATIFKNATSAERKIIHQCPATVPNDKWENKEDVLYPFIAAWPIFLKYYTKGSVPLDGTLGVRVDAAVDDPFFFPFSVFSHFWCKCVGVEVNWFDGCFCHDAILVGSSSTFKRRSNMMEQSGSEQCPWKGKRLVALALGYARLVMAPRLRTARSPLLIE